MTELTADPTKASKVTMPCTNPARRLFSYHSHSVESYDTFDLKNATEGANRSQNSTEGAKMTELTADPTEGAKI